MLHLSHPYPRLDALPPPMASLRAGVLLKLLRGIESSTEDFPSAEHLPDCHGSAVLQVTGIIPALAGSELFPDRGFYLQVSDSSHSTYVSLPPGHDDLVLSDSLQLGQLIHVRRLEPSFPVPVLHGLRLLPGRHPFPHDTTSIPATVQATVPSTCSTRCQLMDSSPTERNKRQPRSVSMSRVDAWKSGSASPAKRQERGRASPAVSQLSKISCIDEEKRECAASSVIIRTPVTDPSSIERKKKQTQTGSMLRVEAWKNGSASPARRQENGRGSLAANQLSMITRTDEKNSEWDASSVITRTSDMNSSSTERKKKRPPTTGNMLRVDGWKSGSASPAWRLENRRASPSVSQLSKVSVNRMDEEISEWDASSVITSTPSSSFDSFSPMVRRTKAMRKNWESTDRSKSGKQESKPIIRTRSATFTQGDFAHSFAAKDEVLENVWPGKREGDAGLTELLNNTSKRKLLPTPSKSSTKNSFAANPFSIYDDIKWPESNVLWGSLSLNLVKYGKEILSQRDAALYTALDALQEACALERLVRCLSAYSDLQASKKCDPQLVVDMFLNFHQELSSAASAAQSLARSNPTCAAQNVPASAMEAAKEASDRRTCAASWIKAALESELSRTPAKSTAAADHLEASRKFQSSLNRQRKCPADAMPRGSCLLTASGRAKALQSECDKWFLRYIERFLDLVRSDSSYTSNDSRIATLLCLLKRVNDWLVTVPGKDGSERSREGILMEDDEAEACGRVRRKIYDFFLRHVESAAMALDSVIATADQDKPPERSK